jgi:hypothetical protein
MTREGRAEEKDEMRSLGSKLMEERRRRREGEKGRVNRAGENSGGEERVTWDLYNKR